MTIHKSMYELWPNWGAEMYSRNLITGFIRKALAGDHSQMSDYTNPGFCSELQIVAMDDIMFMLLRSHKELLQTKYNHLPFNLGQSLNQPHPKTQILLLDYCLIAGLDKLALRLAFCGAASIGMKHLKTSLSNFDSYANVPTMVLQLQALISDIELSQRSRSSNTLTIAGNDTSLIDQFSIFVSEHKYFASLFSIGVLGVSGGIIVYPFFHGVASALLLSVGVPSLLSGVSSLQNSTGAQVRRTQSEDRDRISFEAEELRDLITLAEKTQQQIKMQVLRKSLSLRNSANLMLTDFPRSQSQPVEHAAYTEKKRENLSM